MPKTQGDASRTAIDESGEKIAVLEGPRATDEKWSKMEFLAAEPAQVEH